MQIECSGSDPSDAKYWPSPENVRLTMEISGGATSSPPSTPNGVSCGHFSIFIVDECFSEYAITPSCGNVASAVICASVIMEG